MTKSRRVLCPLCPMCGHQPVQISTMLAQWMCANNNCEIWLWDPYVSAAANLADTRDVSWYERPPTPS